MHANPPLDASITDQLAMQDALLTLTQYWVNHGCLVVQPMNTEVGAGTLNPATALRVLGPEPWQVAYVEPSVRPDDARYGDNPNRIQTHTQFQVILKPEPGDAQELYLGSLQALGIDTHAHDVRFVEDNWASPALGAWGLGWEVWLDGLEITQFTYFQQSGGITLDPVSVEITYGMERIMMALQGVDHFANIAYAPGISYGEAFGQAEYEMSRYYLDDADIAANQTLFDTYATEAARIIDARLPVPAHSYVLKCSHAFNVLDARGAISPTERARAFARMRKLANQVAKLWIARREETNYPLGEVLPPLPQQIPDDVAAPDVPATFLLEIGVEELPPSEVDKSRAAVARMLAERLGATRLPFGKIATYASPRRIVAVVSDVAPKEPESTQTVRGPRVSVAFDAAGNPTKAALGFARSHGIDLDAQPAALPRRIIDGHEYLVVEKRLPGLSATEVLAGLVPEVVQGLRADKNMRWNAPGLSFTRPIRWLVALLGAAVVPCTVSTLASGRLTQLHRGSTDPELEVKEAANYLATLDKHDIVVDASVRRQQIMEQATTLAASVGGQVDVSGDSGLIDEITNLVEEPQALLGTFDSSYLQLPAEVLATVARKHQRYLLVRNDDGALLPHFVAVANGPHDDAIVRAGNEAVLRARYEDALFFYNADLKSTPLQLRAGLTQLTFAERLGSMVDRAERIAAIAQQLARASHVSDADLGTLSRAGELAKFDLASQMVIELSSLAGVMAREYAQQAGESVEVATALYEMELPRAAGGPGPQTVPGALLAVADRADLLAGLFAIGAVPTGSSDPFGMRRAALGLVQIIRSHPELATIGVRQTLEVAAQQQPVSVSVTALDEAAEFISRRFEQQLLDAGVAHQLVQAVTPLLDTPRRADNTLAELTVRQSDPAFTGLVAAIQRVTRIVPADTPAHYDPGYLIEPAEVSLHEAYVKAAAELETDNADFVHFLTAGQGLILPINRFFDDVLVMADDPAVRANRLGLLASIAALSNGILNWSAL